MNTPMKSGIKQQTQAPEPNKSHENEVRGIMKPISDDLYTMMQQFRPKGR